MTEHPNHDQLIGYVLQTLNDEVREEIDQHLRQCTECRSLLNEHEIMIKRIRYGLTGELSRIQPSKRLAFANIAPQVTRTRRWATWRFTTLRSLSLGGEIAIWAMLVIGMLYLLGGPLRPKPTAKVTEALSLPTTLPAMDASFTNRDLSIDTDKPALLNGPAEAWDSGWVAPGAVIFYNHSYHMFYNGGTMVSITISIGYATSEDGKTWTRATSQPVLTNQDFPAETRPRYIRVNSVVVDSHTWVLYFTMSNIEKPAYGRIGRATASSPLGPWKVDPQPVLLPGEHGQWDAGGVGEAFVIQTSNGYAMYYTSGYPYTKIGLATSRDGISWTKYDDPLTLTAPFTGSDPVLKADQAWEVNELGSPSVQRVGERWIMAYTVGSGNGIGYSVSADGVHWIKSSNNPIIERNDDKGITWVNASRLISCQSEVCLYFGAKLEGAAESIVYIATWREP